MGVYIDGTPLEVFQKLGKSYQKHFSRMVEKSDFAGDIAHRIDVAYEDGKMTASVIHSKSSDTKLQRMTYEISGPEDLIEKLHKDNILCSYKVHYLFDDKVYGPQWLSMNEYPPIDIFTLVGYYSGPESIDKAIAACDSVGDVERAASRKELEWQEEHVLEFDDVFINADVRAQYKNEGRPYLNFIWNERNWCYDYTIEVYPSDGGVEFSDSDIHEDDITVNVGLDNNVVPYEDSISVIFKDNLMIFADDVGVRGTAEWLHKAFLHFKSKGVVFDTPLDVLDKVCSLGYDTLLRKQKEGGLKKKILVKDISWDTDGEDPEELELPPEVLIDDPSEEMLDNVYEYAELICDYLSDKYGYCIKGFTPMVV